MAKEKDRFGNNVGRGTRVRDLSDTDMGDGTCKGTGLGGKVLVEWDSTGEEELVHSTSLLVTEKRFK